MPVTKILYFYIAVVSTPLPLSCFDNNI